MVKLDYMGCHYVESTDFVIDRPRGSGNYLLLLFHSDIYLSIDGTSRHFAPGSMIIYTPDHPQHYHNPYNGIDNDWFHFRAPNYDNFLTELSLPLNVPFYIPDLATIHQMLLGIEKEHLMKDRGASYMIDSLTNQLFIMISRLYCASPSLQLDSTSTHTSKFREVRSTILSQLDRPWTLDTMAEMAGLSRSRFCYLYKEIFHVSPKEDLISERFNIAKYLLKSTNQPIGTISAKVGYDNIYQFSKQFKKINGLSPKDYRKSNNSSAERITIC